MNRMIPRFLIVSSLVASAALATWLLLTPTAAHTSAMSINLTHSKSMALSPDALRIALHRIGLGGKSMVAAGAHSPAEMQAMVGAVSSELAETPQAVSAADTLVGGARQLVADLEYLIQSGQGDAEDVTALAAAREDLAEATAARSQLFDDLFNAGVFSLAELQRNRLSTIRANAASWGFSQEYLVSNHSEPDWVKLRDALSAERFALANEEPINPEVEAFLQEVRAHPDVAAGIVNVATNLAAGELAWQQATSQVPPP